MPKHIATKTITLGDASKLGGPLSFSAVIKPAGSLCNLGCEYCYYLDKAEIYSGKEPRMSIDELERFVKRFIEANETDAVSFNWHGGEPLILGLDFYRQAIAFQKKYSGGRQIFNTIQTNGTLVTDDWAKFFRDNGFLVGISIDGPEDIHDAFRHDKGGRPTFRRVISGIEKLYRNGADYNLMSTVNKRSEGRGAEVYSFLKTLGTPFIQFLPVSELISNSSRICQPGTQEAVMAPWSIGGKEYGRFICDVFDVWVKKDVGRVFVNLFDATLAGWCNVQRGYCALAQTCGDNLAIEHNGDVYSCDHFVYPQWKLGNVYQDSFRDMMRSQKQTDFGLSKRESLSAKCRRCRFLNLCNGECPKHRFVKPSASPEQAAWNDGSLWNSSALGMENSLCDGLYAFFEHTEPYMREMKRLLEAKLPPSMIMDRKMPF